MKHSVTEVMMGPKQANIKQQFTIESNFNWVIIKT